MCDPRDDAPAPAARTIPVTEAVGTVLAHDITEIRPGEFKGCAFKKGHIIRDEDVCHLQRLGKERLFVLKIADDELHEDDAARALADALMGEGVALIGEPREGKLDIVASGDGLLIIDEEALLRFNMLGEVMCATLHRNTVVKRGQTVAGTRAIPLVIKKKVIEEALRISGEEPGRGIIEVREMRKARAGIVITGNEVYYGRVRDAFSNVITRKVEELGGRVMGTRYAPDDRAFIRQQLVDLLDGGADLLITTGGMSVDPDDVTRYAVRDLGAEDLHYGSAVLPGAMFLVAYIETGLRASPRQTVPVLGVPACGMYAKTTVFDLVLPRILAGERIGRRQLAELGHGGLCLKCEICRYPVCPFGK